MFAICQLFLHFIQLTFKNSLQDLKHCVLAPLRSQMMQNTTLLKKRVRRLIERLAGKLPARILASRQTAG